MNESRRECPRRALDAELLPAPSGKILRPIGKASESIALNDTAAALWELCDGETAVDEMVDAVRVLFAVDLASARRDVEAVLDAMVRAGVIA